MPIHAHAYPCLHMHAGIPVYNVSNACASGSTSLCLARSLVLSGGHECVLALGFEELKGNVKEAYPEVVDGFIQTICGRETGGVSFRVLPSRNI